MNSGKYVFSQIMGLVSHKHFQAIVNRHSGDYKVRGFSCWKQFLCMAFGQLTHRESISDTLLCLKANGAKLYHLGIGKVVAVSTLTRANENRACKIYRELAVLLIKEAKSLYVGEDKLDVQVKGSVFAIDATTIDLCLTSFYWATFRKAKSGIKLHVQLDLKTSIPEFVLFSNASVHDVNMLDHIVFQTGAYYIMDMAYVDYTRLYDIHLHGAFFVTRAKKNMSCRRLYSHAKDKRNGILYDQTIMLNNHYASKNYPGKLRRIKFKDDKTGKTLVFLTNDFKLKATEIASLYKHRWDIESFFKWIKQHLKVKSFWGHSPNAVKTHIWIALSVYALVAIAKKKFMLEQTLYEILQVLSISVFEKAPLNQLFRDNQLQYFKEQECNQLKLFDL